jgi:hypothetical protein
VQASLATLGPIGRRLGSLAYGHSCAKFPAILSHMQAAGGGKVETVRTPGVEILCLTLRFLEILKCVAGSVWGIPG